MFKVSIIIPTKNEEKYMEWLLKSIKNQNMYFSYEIIVVDNFSNDKTREIAQKYNCKIFDGGIPAFARNIGAKNAKGKWLLFLDADFVLEKNSITKWIEFLEKNGGNFGTPYIKLRKDETNFFAKFYYGNSKIWYNFGDCIFGGCLIVKKDLFEKVGGFDEKMILLEDVDLYQKIKPFTKRQNLLPCAYTSARRFEKIGGLKLIFISSFTFFLYKIGGKKFINFYNKIYKL